MQCSAKRPRRFNALKHGVLLSRYTVLPWGDAEEYRALVAALVAEHAHQQQGQNRQFIASERAKLEPRSPSGFNT
jgi:hypothetical protein